MTGLQPAHEAKSPSLAPPTQGEILEQCSKVNMMASRLLYILTFFSNVMHCAHPLHAGVLPAIDEGERDENAFIERMKKLLLAQRQEILDTSAESMTAQNVRSETDPRTRQYRIECRSNYDRSPQPQDLNAIVRSRIGTVAYQSGALRVFGKMWQEDSSGTA